VTRRPVSIVVLCWNRWELTERCLRTLHAHTDFADVEVVVVDNGSTDETPARLRAVPWVKVVTNPQNLGYVRGNNAGIAAALAGNDVLLLNNDVEVRDDGWLEKLRALACSSPDVGIVGCRLVLPDGRLLHAGTYVLPDTLWGQQIGALEADVGQYGEDRDVQGVVFACALIRREVLDAIGPLSTSYESYFEDTDFCLRARDAGFRTVVAGSVTLVHDEHGSTRDAPEMFDRVFQQSRRAFARRWKGTLDARYDLDLTWQSILNFPTGYAMSARDLLRALDGHGVRVSYSYVYGRGTPFPLDEPEGMGDHLLDAMERRRSFGRPGVSVVYAQGDVFGKNRGRYRIGYTMLEVDGFPAEWVRQANEMDEVWTPSRFNRDSLVSCGVKVPVHVMPLAVDPDHFHPGIRGHRCPWGDFVFLTNFEWGERKQPELLLKVFNEAFRAAEPVVLLCKVINRDGAISVRQRVQSLGLSPSGGRVAFLFNKELPYAEMGALYRSADCFVSAGRGEGWDMPLMEAMACGLPSIATDWGAHTEFVSERVSYPLRVRGTIPARAKCPYYDGFSWADPDPDHLAILLRHVFENREEAAEKGRRAAAGMQASWTWKDAAARVKRRLVEIGAGGR
jgi:GT2 family glycosyltransferase